MQAFYQYLPWVNSQAMCVLRAQVGRALGSPAAWGLERPSGWPREVPASAPTCTPGPSPP